MDDVIVYDLPEQSPLEKQVSKISGNPIIERALQTNAELKETPNLADLEEEWLKPISLKALKKKLKKTFTFRWVFKFYSLTLSMINYLVLMETILRCTYKGCLYNFENIENRDTHERCHISTKQVKEFRCLDCQSESKNWRNCSTHLWKEHKIDIDLLKCPFCTYKVGLSGV